MGAEGFSGVAATAKTQRSYRDAGERLALRWCGHDGLRDPVLVCAAFAGKAKAGMYAIATLRLYREQVLAYVRTLGADPATVAAVMNLHLPAFAVDQGRTSALKMQSIKASDALALSAFMQRKESTGMASIAGLFFDATLMFGLRPVEWCNAKLEVFDPAWRDDVLTAGTDAEHPTHRLTVMNAKANELRGNGEARFIYAFMSVEQAEKTLRVINWAAAQALEWPNAYKALANALYYACHTLWPRRARVPCFYTARHQCIADAKAAGGMPNALAAMFGHASDWTARKHYSRRINGDKNRHMIRASRISLEGVRNQTLTVQAAIATTLQDQALKK